MSAKYKQIYQQMLQTHSKEFEQFHKLHESFVNGEISQDDYNRDGLEIIDIIRDWERRLCRVIGRGTYSKYSEGLAEKFWGEVREDFSHIDEVGVVVKK